MLEIALIPHDAGEEPVLPLSGGGVNVTEQLVVRHCFRIQVSPGWFTFQVHVCSEESFTELSFTGSGVTDYKDRMSDGKQFFELNNLTGRILVNKETAVQCAVSITFNSLGRDTLLKH